MFYFVQREGRAVSVEGRGLDEDVVVLAGERDLAAKSLGEELKVRQEDLSSGDRDEPGRNGSSENKREDERGEKERRWVLRVVEFVRRLGDDLESGRLATRNEKMIRGLDGKAKLLDTVAVVCDLGAKDKRLSDNDSGWVKKFG